MMLAQLSDTFEFAHVMCLQRHRLPDSWVPWTQTWTATICLLKVRLPGKEGILEVEVQSLQSLNLARDVKTRDCRPTGQVPPAMIRSKAKAFGIP